ncbi:MAG: hypothetical protein HYY04_13815 [Chloroflexi bacterium]|nr:hypothetical protein [Chloroflexota bacterium]
MAYFFVKTEVIGDRVDELTGKIARGEITGVEGNISFVSPDGRVGYDVVECRDEAHCRQKYSGYTGYLRITEISRIEPMGQFLERWKRQHPQAA